MRIAIDALAVRPGSGAAVVYLRCLLPALVRNGPEHEWVVIASSKKLEWFRELKQIKILLVHLPVQNPYHRVIYQQFILPLQLMMMGIDMVYGPYGVIPWLFPGPMVVAFHNLKVHDRDWRSSSSRLRWLHLLSWISARRAHAVICPSEYCRQIVIADLGIDPNRVVCVYHGIGSEFIPDGPIAADRLGIHQPYILCISAISQHKNLLSLVRAFNLMIEKRSDLPHKLVFIGGVSDYNYYSHFNNEVISAENLKSRVVIIPGMLHSELPSIYRGATVFVLPSLIESFGLPAIEAMACGVPVIVSKAGALPEVCQDAAIYFEPTNIEELTEALLRVITDQKLRKILIDRSLQRARDFSWDIAAKKTLAIFENAYQSRYKGNFTEHPNRAGENKFVNT